MTKDKELAAAAAALGRKGGLSTSPKAQKAARRNGRKGGRPCRCRLCGDRITGVDLVRAVNPQTWRVGPMHHWCLRTAIEDLKGAPAKDPANYNDRLDEYNERIA